MMVLDRIFQIAVEESYYSSLNPHTRITLALSGIRYNKCDLRKKKLSNRPSYTYIKSVRKAIKVRYDM